MCTMNLVGLHYPAFEEQNIHFRVQRQTTVKLEWCNVH
jgi:hypothetical protein